MSLQNHEHCVNKQATLSLIKCNTLQSNNNGLIINKLKRVPETENFSNKK